MQDEMIKAGTQYISSSFSRTSLRFVQINNFYVSVRGPRKAHV